MAETVVHLLSYVSMDYAGAVQDGAIIDEQEYKEQQEFSRQAYDLTKESSFVSEEDKDKLLAQIDSLIRLVDDKSSEDQISSLGNRINNQIISLTNLETEPKIWPTPSNGMHLYQVHCASCHGDNGNGDGPASKNLDPPPSNFHDKDLIAHFSAYQAYNSIRLGVPQTAMQSYANQLNEAELWDLAFYIKSIGYKDQAKDSLLLQKTFNELIPQIGLSNIANLKDVDLLDSIKANYDGDAETALIALRTQVPSGKDAGNSLPTARQGLQDALTSYSSGNKKLARTQAISAYLEGIEPVEARLRSVDANFVAELETQMFNVRQAIDKDKGAASVQEEVDKAMSIISEADRMLKSQQLNFWLTFVLALTIMLREGMEAFLVLFILLAIIRSSGVKKALPWLHGGWIFALICGVAGWFLSDYIIQFGGKNREVMEGLISLFAVVVLIYVGYWLHSHTEAAKWQHFVKDKIGRYLKKDHMYGLAAFSFIVVFRELFEVILFLQAINLEADAENRSAIGLGVVAALILIGIIAYFLLKTSKKVPIRQLFKYSTWFIILLAIILTGKGVHALQESGWIAVHSLSTIRIEWLGIYPTTQTILAQLIILILVFATYFFRKQRQKKQELLQKTDA